MDEKEIRRRLKALIAMKPEDRPMSIHRLEKMCGFSNNYVYQIAEHKGGQMHMGTRRALSNALKLLENDQVMVKIIPNKPHAVTIRPPQPPCDIVRKLEITKDGPKLRLHAQNPNTFPDYKEKP